VSEEGERKAKVKLCLDSIPKQQLTDVRNRLNQIAMTFEEGGEISAEQVIGDIPPDAAATVLEHLLQSDDFDPMRDHLLEKIIDFENGIYVIIDRFKRESCPSSKRYKQAVVQGDLDWELYNKYRPSGSTLATLPVGSGFH